MDQLRLGIILGRGLTSEVYAWGEGRVLKLYLESAPEGMAEREFVITRAVHAAGAPVPAVHDIVAVGGRFGIVFEELRGPSLLRRVQARPWALFPAARQLAELHAGIHAWPAPVELPSQRQQLASAIEGANEFSPEQKQAAQQWIATAAEGDALCHGDFHPENVILTARGPRIIDWETASCGSRLSDVARSLLLFETADLPADSPGHMRMLIAVFRSQLHATYLKRYLQLRPGTRGEIDGWRQAQRVALKAWQASRGITVS